MISAGHSEQPDEILRAVWVVIAERGMDQVSMRTVAATAGVSVGRIQYRFRSKAELLHASLKAMLRAAVDEHIVATAQAGSRSEEHTSELQSRGHLVCRLLLVKKNIRANLALTHH